MAQPYVIELDEAISRIQQACDGRSLSPFFFMVGAGISYPSVPLAVDIVSKCKEVAKTFGRSLESAEKSPLDDYSHWFQTAYAEPDQRQKYLRELIEGKQITHANFRLAHLLLNNTISNMVVTTNFDDFLSKALTLFGKPHIVCDHPQTVGRINPSQAMLQIVHLHGSYWFYDCCNLRGEVEDRAPTIVTDYFHNGLVTRHDFVGSISINNRLQRLGRGRFYRGIKAAPCKAARH